MATVYVSTTGDDSRTYVQAQSISTPWLTLTKCRTTATTGDTIVLLDGVHTNASNSIGYSLTKSFTIQAQTAFSTSAAVPTWNSVLNAADTAWGMGPDGTSDIALTLRNIEFRNYKNTAGGSDYAFGIGGGAGSGQLVTADIQYCKFKTWGITSTYGAGSILAGSLTNDTAMTWTFNNNLIDDPYDTDSATSYSYIFGVRNNGSGSVYTMKYNTIYLKRTISTEILDGLWWFSGSGTHTLTWTGNIVYSATSIPFYRTGSFTSPTVNYNCHYNISSVPSGTGNITSDPLFVDAASGNFNLQPASPAIDLVVLS